MQSIARNRRAVCAEEGLDSCTTRISRAIRDEQRSRLNMDKPAHAAQRKEAHFEQVSKETERLFQIVTRAVNTLEGLAVEDQTCPEAANGVAGRHWQERGDLIKGMCKTLLASLQSMARFPVLRLNGLDEVHDASEDDNADMLAVSGVADKDSEQAPAEVRGLEGKTSWCAAPDLVAVDQARADR